MPCCPTANVGGQDRLRARSFGYCGETDERSGKPETNVDSISIRSCISRGGNAYMMISKKGR